MKYKLFNVTATTFFMNRIRALVSLSVYGTGTGDKYLELQT